MNTIWDAVMAIVLDAAVVALIVHLLRTKAVNKLERVICVVLASNSTGDIFSGSQVSLTDAAETFPSPE